MSFLLGIVVSYEFSFDDGDDARLADGLQLLPDHHHLGAVVQLLHEVPGLQPRHPSDVNIIHEQDLVTNLQNAILICSST